jgi:hypothetical protein
MSYRITEWQQSPELERRVVATTFPYLLGSKNGRTGWERIGRMKSFTDLLGMAKNKGTRIDSGLRIDCDRCGGAGRYSWNQRDGDTCWGCNRRGYNYLPLNEETAERWLIAVAQWATENPN